MRLGLVIHGDLQTQTGGYLYDRQLVEHLGRAGDQVEIVSLPWRSYPAHLRDYLSPALTRQLLNLRVDTLLQDELSHPSLLAANRRLARLRGIPIVAIVHHLRSSEPWTPAARLLYRAVERAYLRGVDGFVFNSQATRAAVDALVGSGKPFVVAPPGGDRLGLVPVSGDVRARAGQPGPLRVLFVGSLIARKGLHVLLEALVALPAGSWSLEVIGEAARDAPYAARVRRQIARLGLDESVSLRGATDDRTLVETLRRSHVLAGPSAYEGFGIAYLEAMAFGLPVLACAAGGAPEVVVEGETGYLIPPGSPALLAERLRSLGLDRDLLARLGVAARARALAQPQWADSMGSIRQFLARLAPTGAVAPAISVAVGGVR